MNALTRSSRFDDMPTVSALANGRSACADAVRIPAITIAASTSETRSLISSSTYQLTNLPTLTNSPIYQLTNSHEFTNSPTHQFSNHHRITPRAPSLAASAVSASFTFSRG